MQASLMCKVRVKSQTRVYIKQCDVGQGAQRCVQGNSGHRYETLCHSATVEILSHKWILFRIIPLNLECDDASLHDFLNPVSCPH